MLIFINLFIFVYTNSDACGAGPQIYGPTCTATNCMISNYYDMIEYVIDDIIFDTNLECQGRAMNNVFFCGDDKFDWYDLGVLKSGDYGLLYWGRNMGCPQIRCKGQPLPTEFKWSWKMKPTGSKCCGSNPCINSLSLNSTKKYYCCGNTCVPDTMGCCWGNVCSSVSNWCCGEVCYDRSTHQCCTTSDKYGHNVNWLCGIDDVCTGVVGKCCPNTKPDYCQKADTCLDHTYSCCNGVPCNLYCCNNLRCTTWQDC